MNYKSSFDLYTRSEIEQIFKDKLDDINYDKLMTNLNDIDNYVKTHSDDINYINIAKDDSSSYGGLSFGVYDYNIIFIGDQIPILLLLYKDEVYYIRLDNQTFDIARHHVVNGHILYSKYDIFDGYNPNAKTFHYIMELKPDKTDSKVVTHPFEILDEMEIILMDRLDPNIDRLMELIKIMRGVL